MGRSEASTAAAPPMPACPDCGPHRHRPSSVQLRLGVDALVSLHTSSLPVPVNRTAYQCWEASASTSPHGVAFPVPLLPEGTSVLPGPLALLRSEPALCALSQQCLPAPCPAHSSMAPIPALADAPSARARECLAAGAL